MDTLGSGIGQKTLKTQKIRNAHCRTWNMAINPKNVKNETHTLEDLEYGEKN